MTRVPNWIGIGSQSRPSARSVREQEVLRVAATLSGENSANSASAARQEVLTWARNRSGSPLPKEAWDFVDFEHIAAGRNIDGIRIESAQTDIWAIRAEDPDKEMPGQIWTTEVVVGFQKNEAARFSVRLLVSSAEYIPDIIPHSPGVIHQIVDQCGLSNGSYSADSTPWIVNSDADTDELISMLLDKDRRLPIFVLTVPELSDDPFTPLVNPDSLARATLGTAYVVILTAKQTWTLTDRFGKHRSVFGGGVRSYLPGFSESASPYDHRLAIADSLFSNEGQEQCQRWMRSLAAYESIRQFQLGNEVLPFRSIRNAQSQITQAQLVSTGASDADQLDAAVKTISHLEKEIDENKSMLEFYNDEHSNSEIRAKTAEENVRLLTFRIQQLLAQLRENDFEPDSGIDLPTSWHDFENWCDLNLTGRVVLASPARRSVRDPEFEDIGLVARCLLWLANEFHEKKTIDAGSGSLREAEIEDGIRNAHCGSDAYDLDWQGRRYTADWHIKNGGNTRDPRRCLRIYYFWHNETRQVVIADMPAHRRTDAT